MTLIQYVAKWKAQYVRSNERCRQRARHIIEHISWWLQTSGVDTWVDVYIWLTNALSTAQYSQITWHQAHTWNALRNGSKYHKSHLSIFMSTKLANLPVKYTNQISATWLRRAHCTRFPMLVLKPHTIGHPRIINTAPSTCARSRSASKALIVCLTKSQSRLWFYQSRSGYLFIPYQYMVDNVIALIHLRIHIRKCEYEALDSRNNSKMIKVVSSTFWTMSASLWTIIICTFGTCDTTMFEPLHLLIWFLAWEVNKSDGLS